MRNRFLATLCLLLMPGAAWAACSNTVSVKDGGGSTITYCVNTDGGSNKIGGFNILDSTFANTLSIGSTGAAAENLAQIGGTTIDTNSGNKSAGTQRVVLATDQPNLTTPLNVIGSGTAGSAASGVLTVQGIASMTKLLVTPDANSAVNVAQLAGTTTDTNSGSKSAGTLRVVLATDQPALTNALLTAPVATSTGGATAYFVQPTASDNHANIKNGAGTVYSVTATNNSQTINYLRLYNAATGFNGCNSATNLVTQMMIPAGPASAVGAGIAMTFGATGINFSTGISICVTSGYGTNDTTNATASAMSVTVSYN